MNICEIAWGNDSAERDPKLLEYFVDSSAKRRLENKQKSLIIGRKGSGKSALKKYIEDHFEHQEDTHIVTISPSYAAVDAVIKNQDIEHFSSEIFFENTWLRQIFLDALCQIGHAAKGKYASGSIEFAREISIQLNRSSKDIFENITDIIGKLKIKAGEAGEFAASIERSIRDIADSDALEAHFKEISKAGAKFIVLIDDLDLGWDNSKASNDFLLGLLNACLYIQAISENTHCFIFLREDIYSILMSHTQHSDKFRDIERLRWDKSKLIELLEKRINHNRLRFGLNEINDSFFSVFPQTIGTSNTDNWITERTLGRPRELLQLSRFYSEQCQGAAPDSETLKDIEEQYSSWKLDDLCSEFRNQYPDLITIFAFWKGNFFRSKYTFDSEELDDKLLKIMAEVNIPQPWFERIVKETDTNLFASILYEIGFIGAYIHGGAGGSTTHYSIDVPRSPGLKEVQIHPCFRKAVGTVERNRG